MLSRRFWRLVAVVVTLGALVPSAPAALTIPCVAVGDPGNDDDTHGSGYGGVEYRYWIGTYEITAGQYAQFLNAVAGVDTYGLYNADMWSQERGCKIRQIGSAPHYQYLVDEDGDGQEDADWLNRPVNYVSWGDAARFANWMHNGQPSGPQDGDSTESGSYRLNGATTDAELLAVARESDATWVIPCEDEWYKAAYYDAELVTYYDYPTGTDLPPSNDLVDPDPGNSANFFDNGYTIGPPYYRTEYGEFEKSASPYGTFDQGGNVSEWEEAIVAGLYRGCRGGSLSNTAGNMHAANRFDEAPSYESPLLGFRVARVPEPSAAALGVVALMCGLLGCGVLRRRRRGG